MNNFRKQKGASLVEVLISVLIISLALIPAFYGAVSAHTIASSIRFNLTASYLAQEGIEVVRAIRDANGFAGRPFNSGLGNGDWQAQYASLNLKPYADTYMFFYEPSGFYNHTSGLNSPFKRKITLENISSVQIKITSQVTWEERGRTRDVTIESHIFDWQ